MVRHGFADTPEGPDAAQSATAHDEEVGRGHVSREAFCGRPGCGYLLDLVLHVSLQRTGGESAVEDMKDA